MVRVATMRGRWGWGLLLGAALLGAVGGATGQAAPRADLAGTFLVYRCGEGFANLCRINADGSDQVQLTTDGVRDGWYYSSPSLTRDGTRLAYAYGAEMWTADSYGGDRLRISQSTTFAIAFRADGGRIATIERTGGLRVNMFTYAPDGSSRRNERGGPPKVVAWAGDRLLSDQADRASGLQQLCMLVQDDSPCERVVAADPGRDLWGPMVSPDGSTLAAVACAPGETTEPHCALALYDLATATHLRDVVGEVSTSEPAWSPDGTTLAFDRYGVLYLMAVDGAPGSETALVEGVQPTWGGPLP